jgi:hypothetical protein
MAQFVLPVAGLASAAISCQPSAAPGHADSGRRSGAPAGAHSRICNRGRSEDGGAHRSERGSLGTRRRYSRGAAGDIRRRSSAGGCPGASAYWLSSAASAARTAAGARRGRSARVGVHGEVVRFVSSLSGRRAACGGERLTVFSKCISITPGTNASTFIRQQNRSVFSPTSSIAVFRVAPRRLSARRYRVQGRALPHP